MTDFERNRQNIIARNLIKRITEMFYGGNPPTKEQITKIVCSFVITEEWKVSSSVTNYIIYKINQKLP